MNYAVLSQIYWYCKSSVRLCTLVLDFLLFECTVFVQFKAISQAYEVLSDAKKRALYDRGGEQAIKEGGIASDHNPMDIFDMFFGMGGRGGRGGGGGPQRSKDVVHQLKVSLEDLYNGTVRKLALQKNVICAACEGNHSFMNPLKMVLIVFVEHCYAMQSVSYIYGKFICCSCMQIV